MERIIEWDDKKAASNVKKHGIRFEEAARVFDDPLARFEQDRFVDGEERWRTIGMAAHVLLLVAHTMTKDDDCELVRIISARRANKHERRIYEHRAI